MLTSTTAPGTVFSSRSELADHYKSDWHKYNLRRREAGLPMLEKVEFDARWEAALALKAEKEKGGRKGGRDHIKNKSSKKDGNTRKTTNDSATTTKDRASATLNGGDNDEMDTESTTGTTKRLPEALVKSQENPEIDPKQSLFDSHRSNTLQENVEYMQTKYGFFIPDQECLTDVEGMLGYFHEKIKLGHYCLYCEKVFPTWQGCQQHMINKQHTKIRYEQGYWDELDPFYDFERDNKSFLTNSLNGGTNTDDDAMDVTKDDHDNANDDDDEEGGWEDMSDDDENAQGTDDRMEESNDDDDDDELYQGYEKEIERFGLSVTVLGELVFPDGRVVGHRALRRYYKQRPRTRNTSTAVVAAQEAAGERVYDGRVINIHHHQHPLRKNEVSGAGKGILVPLSSSSKDGNGPAQFSALSLYRYRAAVRKQRRGDEKGKRIREKTFQNMNKMDKKANRLMNGVSVAHAAR